MFLHPDGHILHCNLGKHLYLTTESYLKDAGKDTGVHPSNHACGICTSQLHAPRDGELTRCEAMSSSCLATPPPTPPSQ